MNEEWTQEFELLLRERRKMMLEKYHRVLPTGELLFDRFEKAKYLHAGEESSVYDASVIMGDIQIGKHVWIGPFTLIEGINGNVTIGDYVSIDAGVMIYAHDSTLHYLSGGKNEVKKGDVYIGSCTVIGSQSIITCGVSIGNHSVVAANSFVNHDVPDFSIVAGNPARQIGNVVMQEDGTVRLQYFAGDKTNAAST